MGFNIKKIIAVKDIATTVGKKVEQSAGKIETVAEALPKSDPFIMDAKAVSSKNVVDKSLKAAKVAVQEEGDSIVSDVMYDISGTFLKRHEQLLRGINPINEGNFQTIKAQLIGMIDNAEVKNIILECSDHTQLFSLLKNGMPSICGSDEFMNFLMEMSKKTKFHPLEEAEFRQLYSELDDKAAKIFDILTPKSTKPDAIKLEEEIRALGVKEINLADDTKQGELIKSAIEDMQKRKIPIPDSICVTPFLKTNTEGLVLHGKNSHMFLNHSIENEFNNSMHAQLEELAKQDHRFISGSEAHQQNILNKIAKYKKKINYSSTDPRHAIYHESAHTTQDESLKALYEPLSAEEKEIADSTSGYTQRTQKRKEIMPELFAKMMSGQRLTDQEMTVYLKLGGILPKNAK